MTSGAVETTRKLIYREFIFSSPIKVSDSFWHDGVGL